MKLNPSKRVFAIKWEKFLSFLVSSKGIKPNLEKIHVILGMAPHRSIKEV